MSIPQDPTQQYNCPVCSKSLENQMSQRLSIGSVEFEPVIDGGFCHTCRSLFTWHTLENIRIYGKYRSIQELNNSRMINGCKEEYLADIAEKRKRGKE